jgi:predicted RNA binding protein YcfA (HicA-like mRNA interferase family)
VSKLDKLVEKLLSGRSDANVAFDDLRYVLLRLGFVERVHGSHHVYRNPELPGANLVLQPDGKDAKPYQVAQVRAMLLELASRGDDDGSV